CRSRLHSYIRVTSPRFPPSCRLLLPRTPPPPPPIPPLSLPAALPSPRWSTAPACARPRTPSPSSTPRGATAPGCGSATAGGRRRSEEHTSELQSRFDLVCRLLLEKKK